MIHCLTCFFISMSIAYEQETKEEYKWIGKD